MNTTILRFICGVIVILAGSSSSLYAQNTERLNPPKRINSALRNPGGLPRDTVPGSDSLRTRLANDSLQTDTLRRPVGDIKTSINYSAKDSIVTSVDSKIVLLYGDAKLTYGDIELQANQITIDYNTNTLSAEGKLDSLGKRQGYPIFKNGEEVYETKKIRYNFITRQARIEEVVTTQGDGFIHGKTVFKNERNEILSVNNTYTTCNLAHPHFRIKSTKTKAIPDDKIVSGPFNLEILGVPTPLGFPFGMFPAPRKSKSGIIMPEYGEEARRGFFLRGGGYFFDINDYLKLSLTGDIYSKGSTGLSANLNYRKRYSYSGGLSFRVTKNIIPEPIESPSTSTDYSLSWNHSPQTRGTGTFSASVNAATSTFTQNNFLGVNYDLNSSRLDNTTRNLNSSVSYSKTFRNTPFSIGLSARHTQDLSTGQVDLTLPDFNANMRSVYPFKKVSDADLLKNLNLRYGVRGSNRISNRIDGATTADPDSIVPFTMNNLPALFSQSKKGFRHTIPLSTSFRLWYFNVSPSFNYEEKWYFEKLDWGLNDEGTRAVVVDTLNGFNRVVDYSLSVGFNTRIYGNYIFRNPTIKAMRHIINPSFGYSYKPNFGAAKYDYYQEFEVPTSTGETRTEFKSRHDRFAFGGAALGESQNISFGLGNTLEMKVLDRSDTTNLEDGPKTKKVSIFRSLSLSTGYNLAADSFNLAAISIRGNTSLFDNKVTLNFNTSIDPYTWIRLDSLSESGDRIVYGQRRINEFAWKAGGGLGRIQRAGLQMSTNLNPKKRDQEKSVAEKIMDSDLSDADKNFLLNNPDYYVDFSIPWSLRLSYNLNYSRRGFDDPTVTQTLTASGDLSLSEKWKVGFRTGYDFTKKDFTPTNISIDRDLHCWEMRLNWTPFGRLQSYSFVIRVKSQLLQDLKINRKRSFFDN